MGALAAFTGLLQLVQFAWLAREMGKGQFGIAALVAVIVGFAQGFADMGIGAAIIQRQKSTHKELSSLYWMNIALGWIVAILVAVSGYPLATFYQADELQQLMLLVSTSFLIVPLGSQFAALLQRDLRFATVGIVEFSGAATYALSSMLLASQGVGAAALAWGLVLATLVRTISYAIFGWRSYRPSLYFDGKAAKSYLSFGAFQSGSRIVDFLSQNVDNLVVGKVLGTRVLGVYSAAYTAVSKPLAFVQPLLHRVALPVLSRVQEDDRRLFSAYLKSVEILGFLTAPFYCLLALTAPKLVPLILGAGWEEVVPLLQVFAVMGVLLSMRAPIGSLLQAKGRARTEFALNSFILLLRIGAILIGVRWGTIGVAIGLVFVSALTCFALDLFVLSKQLGFNFVSALKAYGLSIGATIPMLLVGWYVARSQDDSIALVSVSMVLVYVLTIAFVRRSLIHQIWTTFFGDKSRAEASIS